MPISGQVNKSTDDPKAVWANLLGIESKEERAEQRRQERISTAAYAVEPVAIDRDQIVAFAEFDLNFLSALCMPEVHKFDFPTTHRTIWQILLKETENSYAQKFPNLALGIPRGHAKTTLIKLYIVWLILFSKKKFILVTAATESRAVDILTDSFSMLSEPNVRGVFGDWKLGIEQDTLAFKRFGFRGRAIVVAAIGSGGSVRGMNVNNERPDIVVFDDIQTKECSESQQQSTQLENWMIGTAMKAKSNSGCLFVYAGNMFPSRFSILKKLKDNANWIKFISGAILSDGSALWPELRSKESLIEELNNDIAMGYPEIFFAEVLNDVTAGINSQVDYTKFGEWTWGPNELPQGKFLVVDPSQGKGLDADVIGYFEVFDEKIGFKLLHEEKMSPGNLIRKAILMAIEHGVSLIAIEAMAYQYTLLYWFEQVCKTVGVTGINAVPLYATTKSKNSRISAGIKTLQTKDMVLHPNVKALVLQQISDWNPMKMDNKDDILDVIGHAQSVLATYTYDIMTPTNLNVIESSAAEIVDNNHLF